MKVSLQMEGMKTNSADVHQPQNRVSNSKMSSRRMILMCVLGIAAVLVIVAVVLGSLYFGTTLYGRTDHGDNMEVDIVSDIGEAMVDTSTEIDDNVADTTMSVLKDMEREQMVYHVESAGACYVARMTSYNLNYSTDNITEQFHEGAPVSKMTKFEITDIEVHLDMLSPKARELCAGSTIVRVVKMNEHDWVDHQRHKRAVGIRAQCRTKGALSAERSKGLKISAGCCCCCCTCGFCSGYCCCGCWCQSLFIRPKFSPARLASKGNTSKPATTKPKPARLASKGITSSPATSKPPTTKPKPASKGITSSPATSKPPKTKPKPASEGITSSPATSKPTRIASKNKTKRKRVLFRV